MKSTTSTTGRKKAFYAWIILLIYVGTPALIFVDVIPWDMKFVALTIGATVVYGLLRMSKSSNESLGLKAIDGLRSIRDVVPVTIALLVLLIAFLLIQGARFDSTETWQFFIFYVVVSCPAQELLFRGALSHMLQALSIPRTLELIMASLLFGYAHFIYRDVLTVVAMTIVGFFWYKAYQKTNNLLGVTVSHIVLGVLTIALGIVD